MFRNGSRELSRVQSGPLMAKQNPYTFSSFSRLNQGIRTAPGLRYRRAREKNRGGTTFAEPDCFLLEV